MRGKARTKGEQLLATLALCWFVCSNGGEGCLFIGDGDEGREETGLREVGWDLVLVDLKFNNSFGPLNFKAPTIEL